ncbi:MAG: undecaprenyldiphospho-muramoylpentapeptide beta-N-acetylglucosaminyltransferase [Bacteroidetes bacterium]|nr:undecaprenyldiphospho-muramoylpentapeptide beta-N-acetylglucosaminyltransferase [Bacteroidota bacterium]
MKINKILISGGGTGGHIFPAIAIANSLKEKLPACTIEFVGAKGRMEMEKIPSAGYKIHGLWITGFQRNLSLKNLIFPLKLIFSIIKCYFIILKFKPDVVIGTGGFASGPLLKMACLLKIPTLIQEQNSFAGVTNKLLGKKVNTICIGFENAARYFPPFKCVFTGNPVRKSIISLPNKSNALKNFELDEKYKTLLIIGGSLGAKSINEAIESNLEIFNENKIQLLWQTGKNYTCQNKPKLGKVLKFIENMDDAYSAADIIISRAGAIAISELCLVGKPVILVPSPNVAEDHQTKNAMALVEKNAAIILKDNDLKNQISNEILMLVNDENKQAKLIDNIKKFAKPEATDSIVFEILKLLKN